MHPHSGPASLGQRLGDLARDLSVLVAVLGIRDRRLGTSDRLEDGGVDLLAVQEDRQAVASDDWRLRVSLEGGKECRLAEIHGGQRPVDRDVGAGAARHGDGQQQDRRQGLPGPATRGSHERSEVRGITDHLDRLRNSGALFPRLGQADGDGLLSARHPLAAAASQRALLPASHRGLDGLARALSVTGHGVLPAEAIAS